MMLLMALALWYASHDHCAEYTDGTDSYYECQTGEELDVTPIQDEAQTPMSHGRN